MESYEFESGQMFDASGVIGIDHYCRRCGYNLRGLREEGICPECGSPVGLSIRGDMLRFADPDWVDKLAMGIKIILWMVLAKVLIAVLIPAGVVSLQLAELLFFAVAVADFYGAWLLTEPEPKIIGEDTNITARRVVRIALIVGIASTLLELIPDRVLATEPLDTILMFLIAGMGLIGLAGEFAKFIYYEQLANRIPDTSLADRARFLRWAYLISLLLGLCLGVVMAITAAGALATGAAGGGFAAMGCIGAVIGLAIFVFGIMTLLLLDRLRKALSEQAKLARENWAGSGGGNFA